MAKRGSTVPAAYLSGKAMVLQRACIILKMCTNAAATTEGAVYFTTLPVEDSAYAFAAPPTWTT